MATNEKSGQSVQKPEQSPEEHFAARRKILGGLASGPVFLTFSPHASAQVASFARCVSNELGQPTTDLSTYYFRDIDQNGDIVKELFTDAQCADQPVAVLSAVCYSSFVMGGGTPTTNVCPAPDASAVDPNATTTTITPAGSSAPNGAQ